MKYVINRRILKALAFFIFGFVFNVYSEKAGALLEGNGKVDFGKYPANEKKEAAFTIHNKNQSILLIKNIRKTCGCVSVSVSKMEIQPGEKSIVKLFVEPESISGAYTKNVYMETNNPGEKFLSLTFSGEAVFPFTVKPQDKINIGRISSDKTIVQEFIIEPSGENYTLGEAQINSDIRTRCEMKKNERGAYYLKVFIEPVNFRGTFKSSIKIPVIQPAGWKAIELALRGKAGLEFAAFPSKIQKYKVDEQGNLEAAFQLKLLGADTVNIASFTISKSENIELIWGKIRGNTIDCGIKIKKREGRTNLPLKIDFQYPGAQPFSVELEGVPEKTQSFAGGEFKRRNTK